MLDCVVIAPLYELNGDQQFSKLICNNASAFEALHKVEDVTAEVMPAARAPLQRPSWDSWFPLESLWIAEGKIKNMSANFRFQFDRTTLQQFGFDCHKVLFQYQKIARKKNNLLGVCSGLFELPL